MAKTSSGGTRHCKLVNPGSRLEPEYTAAEQRRIRAHIRARGMEFRIFLPEDLANWLRKKVRKGIFQSPAEAALVAFQDLQQLDRYPEVRTALLKASLDEALNDPRPPIPAEKVFARLRAQTRRYARTPPPRPKPLPKPRKPVSW